MAFDLQSVAEAITTIVVVVASHFASAKKIDNAKTEAKKEFSIPVAQIETIVKKQIEDSGRIDLLGKRFEDVRKAFLVHDKNLKENKEAMDRFVETSDKILKVHTDNARSLKVWINENTVVVTEPKKGGGSKS